MKKIPTLRKTRSLMAGACAAGALFAGCLTAGAAPITITNFSFETGNTTGWTGGGFAIDPNDFRGSTSVGTGGQGGNFATFLGDSPLVTLIQNTSTVAQLGDTFTFTMGIMNRVTGNTSNNTLDPTDGWAADNNASGYVGSLHLLLNGVRVASNTIATTGQPPVGGFANASVSFTAIQANVGQTVGIEFGGVTTDRYHFDNARLDVTPIPEPGTFGVIAGAAALMLGMVRRRRAS